jgi:hypothetical protein
MSTGLPLADPQFWIVSLAAAAALGLVLRRLLRKKPAGAAACAACPKGKLET